VGGVSYHRCCRRRTYLRRRPGAGGAALVPSGWRNARVSVLGVAGRIVNGIGPRRRPARCFVIAHLPASMPRRCSRNWGDAACAQHAGSAARTLAASWEVHRADWEAASSAGNCPAEATTLALSVDGVMAPLKPAEAERAHERPSARLQASS